jgi:hypothetical protein
MRIKWREYRPREGRRNLQDLLSSLVQQNHQLELKLYLKFLPNTLRTSSSGDISILTIQLHVSVHRFFVLYGRELITIDILHGPTFHKQVQSPYHIPNLLD